MLLNKSLTTDKPRGAVTISYTSEHKPYYGVCQNGETWGPYTYYQCQAWLVARLNDSPHRHGIPYALKRVALLMDLFDQYNIDYLPLQLNTADERISIRKTTP